MAIADIIIVGWETGDSSEAQSTVGTFSVTATNKRTGGYCLRTNPSGWLGYHVIRGLGADGKPASIGRTAETFYTIYLYVAALPSSGSVDILSVQSSAASNVVKGNLTSAGVLTLVGTASSGTVATLSTGQHYRIDMRVTSNGTSGMKVDGGTEQTVTANNVTQDQILVGTPSVNTCDLYWDDLVIGTTSPGGAVEVRPLLANGDGTDATGFTSGTGSTYTEVDERPHDSGTTYWQVTGAADVRGVALQDAATAGVQGTIHAALVGGVLKNAGNQAIRMRSGSSTSDASDCNMANAYGWAAKLATVDPATSAAWSSSGIDGLQAATKVSSSASQLCTMLMGMVCCSGAAAAASAKTLAALGVG